MGDGKGTHDSSGSDGNHGASGGCTMGPYNKPGQNFCYANPGPQLGQLHQLTI